MTTSAIATSAGPRLGSRLARSARSPVALWLAFAAVHAWLVYLAMNAPGLPLGDVSHVYTSWMARAADGYVLGIDGPWVYPILAIAPIAAAAVFGLGNYVQAWLLLVVVLDAAAFAVLIGVRRGPAARHVAAWWWLAFLAMLGPIAIGRIDAVTVPIALVAVLLAAGRPRLAAVLLTVAMWIKIWPAAVIAAFFITSRDRVRILVAVLGTSSVIILVALLLGSGWNVFSFISEQTGRGIQIESPVAAIWMWQAAAGVPGASVYYDHDILTFQVTGQGTEIASAVMTPLLVLVVGSIVAIGVRSQLRGAAFGAIFPPLTLALVLAFIVINKVGSPQFICWLAVPIVIGLVYRGRRYRLPALAALALAGLTQSIYPYLYDWLLIADPALVTLVTVRNLLEIGLLVWAVVAVWKSGSGTHEAAD
ncbi:MAG: glycosyltransferase family 87 protein [Leifsonia sp.]